MSYLKVWNVTMKITNKMHYID